MSDSPKSVGLIGNSLAGNAITERLVRAGCRVYSFDMAGCGMQPMLRLGAVCLDSPIALAQATSRIILASGSQNDAEGILWGRMGVLKSPRRPTHVIDIDTVDPARAIEFGKRAELSGVEFIDATITGTYKSIGHGQGGLIVGGSAPGVTGCSDIFDALTTRWHHIGPSGSAAHGRVILAVMISLHRAALAEALVSAEAFGVNAAAFADLVRASPAYSLAAETKSQQMISRDFTVGRKLIADQRELGFALAGAVTSGQALRVAELQAELLQDAIDHGEGNLDIAAIIEAIQRRRPDPSSETSTAAPSTSTSTSTAAVPA